MEPFLFELEGVKLIATSNLKDVKENFKDNNISLEDLKNRLKKQ